MCLLCSVAVLCDSYYRSVNFEMTLCFHLIAQYTNEIFVRIFKCYDSLVQVPFCEEKSVQLFRVAFFQKDFLQNPYFSESKNKIT